MLPPPLGEFGKANGHSYKGQRLVRLYATAGKPLIDPSEHSSCACAFFAHRDIYLVDARARLRHPAAQRVFVEPDHPTIDHIARPQAFAQPC